MKITVKTPNITQYHIEFPHGHEMHHRCMWATVNIDHDRCTMTATSDCGNYAYRGYPGEGGTFTQLMKQISGEYLLRKIAREDVFDFEGSKQAVIDEAIEHCPENVIDLEQMEDCGEEMFLRCVNDLTDWPYDEIPMVKDYPGWAETFVEVFTKYVQPLLEG
jgi:hypothetical protein